MWEHLICHLCPLTFLRLLHWQIRRGICRTVHRVTSDSLKNLRRDLKTIHKCVPVIHKAICRTICKTICRTILRVILKCVSVIRRTDSLNDLYLCRDVLRSCRLLGCYCCKIIYECVSQRVCVYSRVVLYSQNAYLKMLTPQRSSSFLCDLLADS